MRAPAQPTPASEVNLPTEGAEEERARLRASVVRRRRAITEARRDVRAGKSQFPELDRGLRSR